MRQKQKTMKRRDEHNAMVKWFKALSSTITPLPAKSYNQVKSFVRTLQAVNWSDGELSLLWFIDKIISLKIGVKTLLWIAGILRVLMGQAFSLPTMINFVTTTDPAITYSPVFWFLEWYVGAPQLVNVNSFGTSVKPITELVSTSVSELVYLCTLRVVFNTYFMVRYANIDGQSWTSSFNVRKVFSRNTVHGAYKFVRQWLVELLRLGSTQLSMIRNFLKQFYFIRSRRLQLIQLQVLSWVLINPFFSSFFNIGKSLPFSEFFALLGAEMTYSTVLSFLTQAAFFVYVQREQFKMGFSTKGFRDMLPNLMSGNVFSRMSAVDFVPEVRAEDITTAPTKRQARMMGLTADNAMRQWQTKRHRPRGDLRFNQTLRAEPRCAGWIDLVSMEEIAPNRAMCYGKTCFSTDSYKDLVSNGSNWNPITIGDYQDSRFGTKRSKH